MAVPVSASSRWLRRSGHLLLLCSLLGWSAWWAICNVYEYAPDLPTWPLLAAWGAAVVLPMRRSRRAVVPLLLAGINGLCVLLQHRAGADGVGPALLPLVALMIAVLCWNRR